MFSTWARNKKLTLTIKLKSSKIYYKVYKIPTEKSQYPKDNLYKMLKQNSKLNISIIQHPHPSPKPLEYLSSINKKSSHLKNLLSTKNYAKLNLKKENPDLLNSLPNIYLTMLKLSKKETGLSLSKLVKMESHKSPKTLTRSSLLSFLPILMLRPK